VEPDGIRVVKIDRGKVNAIDVEFADAIVAEMKAAADPSVKAIIITGSGSSFSAGVDLVRLVKDGPDYARRFLPALDEFLHAVLTFPKPVIAAINGHAIAGGCILAAACDHRIMTEGPGRIGIPELAVGVPFPALPLQIMAGRLAAGALRELVFSGRTVLIDEAKSLGLIDEKCPAGMLLDRAHEVAQHLMAIPAATFALTKEAFYSPIVERARQLADLNARVAAAWEQQHTYETIRRYLEKTVGKK
jgi:enoyl-CoA hydratase